MSASSSASPALTRYPKPPAGSVSSVRQTAPARPEGVRLAEVAFDRLREDEAIRHVLDSLDAGRGGWVITSNLDHLRRATRDPEFSQMLDEADLVVADGTPLIWASRLQGTPLPERVAGSSLVRTLSAAAAERGRSVFLLGGDPGTAEQAGQVLCRDFPDLRLAGAYCPPMGFEHDEGEMRRIRQVLAGSGADLVYVALGSPKQERLIREVRDTLPQAWWMGVGISLSFLCGRIRRAPPWMQRVGLEWLHRMAQEPRRLFRRYLVHGLPFACVLGCTCLAHRLRTPGAALIRPAEAGFQSTAHPLIRGAGRSASVVDEGQD